MHKLRRRIALALIASILAPGSPAAPAMSASTGEALFGAHCKSCHDPAVERAPARTELARRPRSEIVAALSTGVMAPMAQGLSSSDIEALARFLSPSDLQTRVSSERLCEASGPIKASNQDWPEVAYDANSTRFQSRPGLRASEVPRLKVKWAFAMPGGGQPIVIGDWLYMTNRGGRFYALDAKTGCVHWSVDDAAARTSAVVVRSAASPSGWLALIGVTSTKNVRAFDAQTGRELWHSDALESHPAAGITGTPVVSQGMVFVPLSSGEEVVAMQPNYPCCSFRGSVAALDLATGQKKWQTSLITEPLQPLRQNSSGVMMQGPAGAPVWAAPTADARRGLLYIVTGDSYTDAPAANTDSIVALDMKSGALRWRTQATADDNFIQGCFSNAPRGANCPKKVGPDFDFGASPILFGKPGSPQVLLAAQKSGIVYGLDPDTGRRLWSTKVGSGSALGGIEWGISADERRVFVPNSDFGQMLNELSQSAGAPINPDWEMPGKPGLSALDPFSGKVIWNVPAPIAPCHYAGDRSKDFSKGACIRSQSAAPAVMPGIVFSGSLDGWLRAYDAASGKIVWQFSTTAQTYSTVNGVPDQPGGGIDGMGPTVAGGMLYTMSGFNGASQTGSNGINVLLAFSVDGK